LVRWRNCRNGLDGAFRDPRAAPQPKLRSWRVSILRQRAKVLGNVQAPDEKTAEAEAVVEFKLNDEQRKRLVVQERD
jgi:hypothetical protein